MEGEFPQPPPIVLPLLTLLVRLLPPSSLCVMSSLLLLALEKGETKPVSFSVDKASRWMSAGPEVVKFAIIAVDRAILPKTALSLGLVAFNEFVTWFRNLMKERSKNLKRIFEEVGRYQRALADQRFGFGSGFGSTMYYIVR